MVRKEGRENVPLSGTVPAQRRWGRVLRMCEQQFRVLCLVWVWWQVSSFSFFVRSENGECLSPYTPPPGADPGNKICSCYAGCIIDSGRIGGGCGCASLGVGCSGACACQGGCHNGHR